jgi:hypothetical protein
MMITLMKYRYECGLAPAKQKIVSALIVGFKGSEISFLSTPIGYIIRSFIKKKAKRNSKDSRYISAKRIV